MTPDKIHYQRKIVHKLTQKQLADKIGVSRSTINNWESGSASPSLRHIVLMSIIFKVSVHYLIFASNNEDEIVLNHLNQKQKNVLISLFDCFMDENITKDKNCGKII